MEMLSPWHALAVPTIVIPAMVEVIAFPATFLVTVESWTTKLKGALLKMVILIIILRYANLAHINAYSALQSIIAHHADKDSTWDLMIFATAHVSMVSIMTIWQTHVRTAHSTAHCASPSTSALIALKVTSWLQLVSASCHKNALKVYMGRIAQMFANLASTIAGHVLIIWLAPPAMELNIIEF